MKQAIQLWRNQKFRAWFYQALLLLVLVSGLWLLADTTLDNMRTRGIQSGYDFLGKPAGFQIGESLIDYQPSDPYWKAFLVGLLNTLRVALLGIVLATLLGTLLGVGRFSKNALIRGLCLSYVEVVRNIPLLLQLFVWYLIFVNGLPDVTDAEPFLGMYLSKDGLAMPMLSFANGLHWESPVKETFSIQGGLQISPEFFSLLIGLTVYTASYIAEIVRSGIAAVSRGQQEAALSLGLSRMQALRFVQLPQALRVIIPPLTSQYLNLTKNSSLAVAVGYPDLVFVANTANNNVGRGIECMALIMLVYLTLSLATSLFMNWYNQHVALQER